MRYYQARYSALVILALIQKIGLNIPKTWRTQLNKVADSNFSTIEQILKWDVEKYLPKTIPETGEVSLLKGLSSLLKSKIMSEGITEYHNSELHTVIRYREPEKWMKNLFAYLSATHAEYPEQLGRAFYEGLHGCSDAEHHEEIWKECSEMIADILKGESLETKVMNLILDQVKIKQ